MALQTIGLPIATGNSRHGPAEAPDTLDGLFPREINSIIPPTSSRDGLESQCNHTKRIAVQLQRYYGTIYAENHVPITIGGDHTVPFHTLPPLTESTSLIWLDAHGDFHIPETSPSKNLHGMVISTLLGDSPYHWGKADAISAENTYIIGAQALDEPEEVNRLADSSVTAYKHTDDIDYREVFNEVFEDITTDNVYISIDMDWIHPQDAPGVSVPQKSGPAADTAFETVSYCLENIPCDVVGVDIVEFNPRVESDQTSSVATEMYDTVYSGLKN